jgi:hypothetical protein
MNHPFPQHRASAAWLLRCGAVALLLPVVVAMSPRTLPGRRIQACPADTAAPRVVLFRLEGTAQTRATMTVAEAWRQELDATLCRSGVMVLPADLSLRPRTRDGALLPAQFAVGGVLTRVESRVLINVRLVDLATSQVLLTDSATVTGRRPQRDVARLALRFVSEALAVFDARGPRRAP